MDYQLKLLEFQANSAPSPGLKSLGAETVKWGSALVRYYQKLPPNQALADEISKMLSELTSQSMKACFLTNVMIEARKEANRAHRSVLSFPLSNRSVPAPYTYRNLLPAGSLPPLPLRTKRPREEDHLVPPPAKKPRTDLGEFGRKKICIRNTNASPPLGESSLGLVIVEDALELSASD